jgi:hypothetical protein
MNGCAKNPDAALRFVAPFDELRAGSVFVTVSLSNRVRLACGTFCGAVLFGKALRDVCAVLQIPKSAAEQVRCRPFRPFALLAALLLAVGGCAGLPPLKPLDPSQEPAALESCRRPFLTEKYRLVHSLNAGMPGGREGQAIGVLVADPRTGGIQSVLMTIEGLVLFDIEYDRTLIVHRAVPPFDAPAFARRMAEDIGLAFFPPGGKPAAWGREEGGGVVCRFERAGGEIVDVLKAEDGAVEIRLYGAGQELRKKVSIPHLERPGLADELEIRGTGWPPYSLHLRLIEAEAVEP